MTPDLKRLCEAAEEAFYANIVPASDREELQETLEAVVRAVLMALREPSSGMLDEPYNTGWFNGDGTMDRKPLREEFAAMIDHVLAEPAKA